MTILEFAEQRVRSRTSAPPPVRTRPPRRSRGGTFLLPPWRRAPLMAFRHPAVILAVVAAAAILACATSSASLFLSSSSSEAMRRILAASCPDAPYPTVNISQAAKIRIDASRGVRVVEKLPDLARAERNVPRAMTGSGLPAPIRTIQTPISGQGIPPAIHGQTRQPIRMFYGDGALDHVDTMSRISGNGMMISSAGAEILSVRPGDSITLAGVPVRIVGVYKNLFAAPLPSYWCSYTDLGIVPCPTCGADPPPLGIFTDPGTFDQFFLRVAQAAGTDARVDYRWLAPIDTDGLTLTRARAVLREQRETYRRLGLTPANQVIGSSNQSLLPKMTDQVTHIRDGLRGPVVPIALGGALLALLLVGAAGSYWADRRAREVRLLSSRGVGPGGLALKAALELTLPAVVGTVLGWLLARWLVATLGPGSVLDPSAPGDAALTAALGLAAGVLLLALVAGLRARNATERPVGARRSWAAIVPWEVLIIVAAGLSFLRLRGERAVVLDGGVAQVNLLLMAAPLLFLLGTAVLTVRLLTTVLRPLRRHSQRWPVPLYLAVSRITSAPVVAVTLLAALAMPVAMVVYSAGITKTSQYTVDAKTGVFIGGRASIVSVDRIRRTPALDRVATMVDRYERAHLGSATGPEVTVLAVDPDTLPRFAFWDDRFADRSLDDLMSRLAAPPRNGTVPALFIDDASGARPTSVRIGDSTVPLRVVGTPRVFPGDHSPDPMVVVSAAALGDRNAGASRFTEYWSDRDAGTLSTVLTRSKVRILVTYTQQKVQDVANFLAVTWSFGYLEALAALVGLITIGGLLLYLETRARSRAASFALSQRMGLSRRGHLLSMLTEMGMVLGAASVVGAALGWLAVLPVYGRIDLDTSRPPGPLLTVPVTALAGAALAACLVAVAAAGYAHHSAGRTDPSEVLRLGE
ncbi:MAG TPA: FtsX-like permease family protein [Mycobacteriales bacterium]|nr:FtsX-like permease family protein [Mycobacteriales bacterium]